MTPWADSPEAPFTAHGAKTEVGGVLVSDARDGGRNFSELFLDKVEG